RPEVPRCAGCGHSQRPRTGQRARRYSRSCRIATWAHARPAERCQPTAAEDAMTVKLSELRKQYPMLAGANDDQFISALHRQFAPQVPIGQFAQGIDYDTQREALQQQTLDEMGGARKFAAGAGHEVQQLLNTGKRLIPGSGYGQADAEEEAQLAAPLMHTGAGMAGGIAGDIALQYLGGKALQGAGAVAGRLPSMLPQALARAGQAGAKAKGCAGGVRDIASNAAQGAGCGASLSPENFGQGAALGGAIGGGLGTLGAGAKWALGGPAQRLDSADAQALQQEGINVPWWKATDKGWLRGLGAGRRGA